MNTFDKLIRLAAGGKTSPAKPIQTTTPAGPRLPQMIAPKAQSLVRKDIKDWTTARRLALNPDRPRRAKLIELYNEIELDAHLTSQKDARIEASTGAEFVIRDKVGEIDEATTARLQDSIGFGKTIQHVVATTFYGHSLLEFTPSSTAEGEADFTVSLIPRQNVIPQFGIMLFDIHSDSGLKYRELPEYGSYVIELGDNNDLGLLNKTVPHALFKRFAQSCWSELAEIYGIPPRYIQTDTTDPAMVARAEAMMQDMGAAAWWIIDTTEQFNFAKGADTNGDVYSNLIRLCNNEISLLISGAIVGQDTEFGNRSKEEVGLGLLAKKVKADRKRAEDDINSIVLPALARLGIVPEGATFKWVIEEDTEELWQRTATAMQHFDVDPEWIRDKFGIEVIGPKTAPTSLSAALQNDPFFVRE